MMKHKQARLFSGGRVIPIRFGSLVALLLAAGCISTKNDIRQLQMEVRGEIETLSARQDSLMALLFSEAESTQDTLRVQADQFFDFRGEINRQLRAITQGLTTLEAIAGENQRGIASMRDQLGNLRRLNSEPQPIVADNPAVVETGGENLLGTGGSADQLWGVAREQHMRGSYSTAQVAYEQFLENYPSHDLAPDAHFNLADMTTQQDRPEDALEAFQEIQTLYPTSSRVPDALYRIAQLQVEMGDADDARVTLERIMNTYPDATIAMLARDLLEEIS